MNGDLLHISGAARASAGVKVAAVGFVAAERSGGTWIDASGSLLKNIARGYGANGQRLSLDLDGEYAFVILDGERITAGTDFYGKRKLFYATDRDGGVTISSSLARCLENRSKPAIDEDYVADFLVLGSHFGRRTPFRGVSRLSPGDTLSWTGSANVVNLLNQWRPVLRDPGEQPAEAGEQPAEALLHLLRAAVRTYLPHGRAGCELSGGLDSSTVFRLARALDRATSSFSLIYPRSPQADETRFIDAALGGDRANWHPVDADAAGAFTADPESAAPEPVYSLIYAGRSAALRQAAEAAGVQTVLTGIGGDSMLFGDHPRPYHIADRLRRGYWLDAWREAGRWHRQAAVTRTTAYWLRHAGVDPLRRWLRDQPMSDAGPAPDWFCRDWAVATCGRARRALISDRRGVAFSAQLSAARREAQNIALFYDAQVTIDFRHPLLSLPLSEFMLGLPAALRYAPECDRLLHRHAIERVVPDEIRLRRSKGGTDESIFAGLRGNPRWQQRLCDDPVLARRGYIDRERWRRAVRLFAAGHCSSIRLFQATAVLETWFQQFAASGAGAV